MISSLVAVLDSSRYINIRVLLSCCYRQICSVIYLDQNNIGAGFGQGKGHCLANTACAASDEGGPTTQGEERSHSCCHCALQLRIIIIEVKDEEKKQKKKKAVQITYDGAATPHAGWVPNMEQSVAESMTDGN